MKQKLKLILPILLIILAFYSLFINMILFNKIVIFLSLFLVAYLLSPLEKFNKFSLLKRTFLAVSIILIPLTYYFGINNYIIQNNPIMYQETYGDVNYTFNNLEATFFVDGASRSVDFKYSDEIYWKRYFKGFFHINFSEKMTSIGNYNFYKANKTTDVTTGDEILSIGNNAFSFCEKLSKFNSEKVGIIIMPQKLVAIGNEAFYKCEKIEKIYFYKNIQFIGDNAFFIDNLKDVYFEGTQEEWEKVNIRNNFSNISIHFNALPEDL